MTRRLALLTTLMLCGCSTVSTQQRPADYSADMNSDTGTASLFSGDAGVLSDSEIQRILSHQYNPPKLSRIALLPSGWTRWGSWSEDLSLATEQIDAGTISTLSRSARVYDASFLPSILIPKERTVPYLREAAARYQADLLLVYRSACRSFERYRFFEPDSTRAYCSVETVLLDVRTGLVPFTASAARTFEARRSETDLNMREAILKAQLSAISDAMQEVATLVVGFLEASNEAGS